MPLLIRASILCRATPRQGFFPFPESVLSETWAACGKSQMSFLTSLVLLINSLSNNCRHFDLVSSRNSATVAVLSEGK